jgi:predicted PhzF superfamily epimerase YddE/YHI9
LLPKVAAENNLSETAFIASRTIATISDGLRPLRGSPHGYATLASAYVILNLLQAGFQTVGFGTRLGGALTVSREGEKFAMNFPAMFGENCAHRVHPSCCN